MVAPRAGIISVAVALATLGRAGAVLRGSQNATQYPVWRLPEQGGPCECRNWKSLYSEHVPGSPVAVQCGVSQEFFFASGIHQPSPEHVMYLKVNWDKFCWHFFEKIDDNVCLNVNIGTEYGQWCYVSHECTDLGGAGGGGLIAGHPLLKWKKCARGSDRLLKDFSVPDLVKFVQKHDVPFYMADHFAWPTFYHGLWYQVQDYFVPGSGNGTAIGWELREELDAIVDYSKPVAFDHVTGFGPPHTIVEGTERYSVVHNLSSLSFFNESTWTNVFRIDNWGTKHKML